MMRATRLRPAVLAAAALPLVLLATPASAQTGRLEDTDWRQTDRHDALAARGETAQGYRRYIELRFGPYLPGSIDRADPGLRVGPDGKRATPFADAFGLDCDRDPPVRTGHVSPRLYVGLEVDYLPLRMPYVGSIGFGLGWGFTRFANRALYSGKWKCSSETTSLIVMPMHASLVLRVDELIRRTGVPFVPYGKLGAGLTWWRAANDSGTEKFCGTPDAPRACERGDGVAAHGNGLLPTLHLAAGLMLAIDALDPSRKAGLRDSGIGHAYAFGEVYSDSVTLGQHVLHVGTTSWVAGLAIDL
ncbi:MAG: MXAN_2562 family outer membrane beta-barrel protein [Minicystis sp.]